MNSAEISYLFPELVANRSSTNPSKGSISNTTEPAVIPQSPRNRLVRSFADTVQNRPVWTKPGQIIEPVRKGNHLSIPINDEFYSATISDCLRFALIGRLILPKGSSPWQLQELKDQLRELWKGADWNMLSIGQGYYVFKFAQEAMRDEILARSSWKLTRGVLYTRSWVPDFVPAKASSTKAKVWQDYMGFGMNFYTVRS